MSCRDVNGAEINVGDIIELRDNRGLKGSMVLGEHYKCTQTMPELDTIRVNESSAALASERFRVVRSRNDRLIYWLERARDYVISQRDDNEIKDLIASIRSSG